MLAVHRLETDSHEDPRVFVDGQEGTTGLRIHEYLAQREDIEVLRIDPTSARIRPSARTPAQRGRRGLPSACPTPRGQAAALVTNPKTCLIDASTAHRTAPGWVFGLPELRRSSAALHPPRSASPTRAAASAFILLLRPLVDAGLVPARAANQRQLDHRLLGRRQEDDRAVPGGGDARLSSPRPYGLKLAHKHIPEMTVHGGLAQAAVFMPVVANFYGFGGECALHLSQLPPRARRRSCQRCLAQRYAGERFVRVMPLSDPATLEDGFFDVRPATTPTASTSSSLPATPRRC